MTQYITQDEDIRDYLPEAGFFITVKTRIQENAVRGPRETKKFKLWWKSVENSETVVAKVLSLGTKVRFIDSSELSDPFESQFETELEL